MYVVDLCSMNYILLRLKQNWRHAKVYWEKSATIFRGLFRSHVNI